MTTPRPESESSPITAEEIEAMLRADDPDPDEVIEAKIQEAIAKAVEAGEIDAELPIVVGIDPTSGRILVDNAATTPEDDTAGSIAAFDDADDAERLPAFKLPDSFFQRSESLADDRHHRDHFEKHWGF